MTRVKGGTVSKTRRRKVLKEAKGYFGSKHRLYKTAQEQVFHSGVYAYRDRKANKRNFRKLVKLSKDALDGKVVKTEPKKVEAKASKEPKTTKPDYSTMTLTELKALAKEQSIKGYSTMKKDELLANLK